MELQKYVRFAAKNITSVQTEQKNQNGVQMNAGKKGEFLKNVSTVGMI